MVLDRLVGRGLRSLDQPSQQRHNPSSSGFTTSVGFVIRRLSSTSTIDSPMWLDCSPKDNDPTDSMQGHRRPRGNSPREIRYVFRFRLGLWGQTLLIGIREEPWDVSEVQPQVAGTAGNSSPPKGVQLPAAWQWYGDAPARLPADRTVSRATDGAAGDESTAVVGHLHVPSRAIAPANWIRKGRAVNGRVTRSESLKTGSDPEIPPRSARSETAGSETRAERAAGSETRAERCVGTRTRARTRFHPVGQRPTTP